MEEISFFFFFFCILLSADVKRRSHQLFDLCSFFFSNVTFLYTNESFFLVETMVCGGIQKYYRLLYFLQLLSFVMGTVNLGFFLFILFMNLI